MAVMLAPPHHMTHKRKRGSVSDCVVKIPAGLLIVLLNKQEVNKVSQTSNFQ